MTWTPKVLANSFISLCVSQCMVKVMGKVPFQTLTMHCNIHRDMHELARTCGNHVTDTNLCLERQTVYNIIKLISTTNTEILAALSMICFNPSLRNSLVKTVDWLITADPKKKSAKNQNTANIGPVEVKNGIG